MHRLTKLNVHHGYLTTQGSVQHRQCNEECLFVLKRPNLQLGSVSYKSNIMASYEGSHSVSTSGTNATWMSSLPQDLRSLSLTQLAIPGSHNSGTFALDMKADLAPDQPKELRAFMSIPGAAALAKASFHSWAKCQRLDFTQQLNAGIRFFDLRVSTQPGSEDLFLVHTFYGPKVSEFIEAVSAFLTEHSQEIVLLDFNHFYNMEMEHHMQLVTLLMSAFEGKICGRCDVDKLTLESMSKKGHQVIIFYGHEEAADCFEDTWTKHHIKSLWADCDNTATCLTFLTKHMSAPPQVPFIVCQGVLTPNAKTVMGGLLTNGLEALNKPFLQQFCTWIKESPKSRCDRLNIVAADFVDSDKFIQTVIDLNRERIAIG